MRKSVQTVTYSKHVTFMGVKFSETNAVFAAVTMRNIAGNLEIRVLTLKFAFFGEGDNSEKRSLRSFLTADGA